MTHLEFLPLLYLFLKAGLIVCNFSLHALQQCQELLPKPSIAPISRGWPATKSHYQAARGKESSQITWSWPRPLPLRNIGSLTDA